MASRIAVNRGTTYIITLTYAKDGAPASLVGAIVFFTVKSAEFDSDTTDASALISKTKSTFTETGDDPANGVAVIVIDPSDTVGIDPGKYYYDIKVKDSTGAIYKVDEGRLTLDGSPTNRLS